MTLGQCFNELFRAAWDASPAHRRCVASDGRLYIVVERDGQTCLVQPYELTGPELRRLVPVSRLSGKTRDEIMDCGLWIVGEMERDSEAPTLKLVVAS